MPCAPSRHRVRPHDRRERSARRAAPSPAPRRPRESGREGRRTSTDVSSARAMSGGSTLSLASARRSLSRFLDFARRDLEPDHLATLREHAVRRVEDLAARRRNRALRRLLPFGARAPILAVDQLDAARLDQNRQREHRERRVRQADSSRANHASGGRHAPAGAEEEPAARAWGCACSNVARRSAADGRGSTRRESRPPVECAPPRARRACAEGREYPRPAARPKLSVQ